MKILANRKIKRLFLCVASADGGFIVLTLLCMNLQVKNALVYVMIAAICMMAAVFVFLYLYFREQNKIMEDAISRIRDYISGDRDVRLECNEEGELYRLFHEINSLASILNAHGENEERAKKFMKDTISDISHQLKTPLAALNIYNGLMQQEAEDVSEIKEFTALSEKELDRIENLVQNFLKITKLDSGTIIFEKKMENISEMMDYIERHFACQARQEGKKLSFSGDEKAMFFCDQNWMTEAISNLVKNALDHTEEGDSIQVEWRESASILQILIRDNGRGIHPEDMPHIFKRFYRSRFSKDKQGVGLGLPLAKAIIEAHSGTIEVDSQLGRGTVFTVNFLIPTKL